MQIDGYRAYGYGLQNSSPTRAARSSGSSDAAGGTGTVAASPTSAADAFLAEAKKTPAERIRDDWLARNKMTEKDLQAMSPEKREAIEKEIAEELKRKLTGAEAKRGAVMNLTA
ncbi:hypothetical protein [Azospirillum humicireducens]|nr:hypothetical protein [Azospirillum humicireducens]